MNKNNVFFNAVKICSFAEKLFNKLDAKLDPKTYVIALNKNNDSIDFYLEPIDNDKYAQIAYKELKSIIKNQTDITSMSDIVSEFEIISTFKDYFKLTDKKNNKKSFFSKHVSTKDSFLIILLQFNRDNYNSHFSLNNDYESSTKIYSSLLNAVIERFLYESSKYLHSIHYQERSVFDNIDNETQVIRWAGVQLMTSIGHIIATKNKLNSINTNSINNFFDDCNIISSLLYEGRESKGKILIAPNKHVNIEEIFILKNPVEIKFHRTIRKLLETCADNTYLLYKSGFIYGVGTLKGKYNPDREDLFLIVFKKHYNWTLLHYSNEMMSVSYGFPKLTDKPFENEMVKSIIKNKFLNLKKSKITELLELINYATMQKHGTILVISENAEKEAIRLKNQAIIFEPFQLKKESLLSFTNIDGAMFIDLNLKCHAVGVILDGVATEKGSPARGARYNSAARYVDSQKSSTLAVVVSEDGMVNLLY